MTVFALFLWKTNTVTPLPHTQIVVLNAVNPNQTLINTEVSKNFYKLHSHLGYNCTWDSWGTLHDFILDYHLIPQTEVQQKETILRIYINAKP